MDNECSVHGKFNGQVCVSCAQSPDNECNLHGPFHGMVCPICFDVAKGAAILVNNPPDEIDWSYVGTLEREIERLLNERCCLIDRLTHANKIENAAAKVSNLLQPGGGRLGLVEAHKELRDALFAAKPAKGGRELNWLCKIGVHRWLLWTPILQDGKQYRMCERCWLYQSRLITAKPA